VYVLVARRYTDTSLQISISHIIGHSVDAALSGTLALHPQLPLMAYAAGSAVVLFDIEQYHVFKILHSSRTVRAIKGRDCVSESVSYQPSSSTGHGYKAISALAWSNDGRYLAVGEVCTGQRFRFISFTFINRKFKFSAMF
jgi:hypothetical protein